MAGGQERVLRQRIKTVKSTRKITKAMELIAASQISKAQAHIAANRPYRAGMQRIIIEAVQANPAAAAKMLSTPDHVDTVAVLVIVGDRGLSGAYNSSVLRATERLIAELKSHGSSVQLFAVGRKSLAYFRYRGVPVERTFQGFSDKPEFGNARDVAGHLAVPFASGAAQKVMMVSMRFHSSSSQSVEVRQVLPFAVPESETTVTSGLKGYTEFEPDVEKLLVELAPRALESEVYSALLEGAAAFHTSQQRAMAAATDNADELSRTLSRVMNRARQDSITTEIMEIVGGAEALRSGK